MAFQRNVKLCTEQKQNVKHCSAEQKCTLQWRIIYSDASQPTMTRGCCRCSFNKQC